MRVVDTSAWIEWLIDSATGRAIRSHLPTQVDWIVPTIVQLELVKWLMREVGEERTDRVIAFTRECVVADLDTPLALTAAEISVRHRMPTADAVIYATAQAFGADVLTCDGHFADLPNVMLVAKRQE